jgi:uncharacterized protein
MGLSGEKPMTFTSEQPVSTRERILALDIFRGFAMFGVLLAYCMWSLGTAPDEGWSRLDTWLGEAFHFLGDGKFYTILAFLFGFGFSIQLSRAADDTHAVETYCRRLAALAAIGLVHALLLRNGDILLPYALTGFFMIPFRRLSDRAVLFGAFIALLIPGVAHLLWTASGVPIPERPQLVNAPYLVENASWVRYWYSTAVFSWPTNLTLFLFGLLAGRHHVLPRLEKNSAVLWKIVLFGPAAATVLYFASRQLEGLSSTLAGVTGALLFTVQCWGMSSAYAASLLLTLRTAVGRALLTPLAAIGRMALTNYLMQAGVIVPLCLAFGWFDHFTPTRSIALTLALFAFQVPFSMIWLRYFEFGPAEWVWRLFTYGRFPALKRAIAVGRG